MNVLLCLIGFFIFLFLFCLLMNIHIYNLFYICTGTHACMGFVPDNKLIRIRINNILCKTGIVIDNEPWQFVLF